MCRLSCNARRDFSAGVFFVIFWILHIVFKPVFRIESAPDKNGKTRMIFADGDLNNMIKAFKKKVREYYINNLVETLYEYEFLK